LPRGDAEHADGEGGEVRIPGEPHRPQVPDLAVPLGERHVVDERFSMSVPLMEANELAARPRSRDLGLVVELVIQHLETPAGVHLRIAGDVRRRAQDPGYEVVPRAHSLP